MSSERPKKNLGSDIAQQLLPDIVQFVEMFCAENDLVAAEEVGCSAEEKDCVKTAERARAEFLETSEVKTSTEEGTFSSSSWRKICTPKRLLSSSTNGFNEPLTSEEKYQRRLFINQKSAAGGRVFKEVLARAYSTMAKKKSVSAELTELKEKGIEVKDYILREEDWSQSALREQQAVEMEQTASLGENRIMIDNQSDRNRNRTPRTLRAGSLGEQAQPVQTIFCSSYLNHQPTPNPLAQATDNSPAEMNLEFSREEAQYVSQMNEDVPEDQHNAIVSPNTTLVMERGDAGPPQSSNDGMQIVPGPFSSNEGATNIEENKLDPGYTQRQNAGEFGIDNFPAPPNGFEDFQEDDWQRVLL